MTVRKVPFAVVCAALLLRGGPLLALSMVRPGEPRIKFNRFVGPERVEHGEEFRISAFVTPLRNIWEPEHIFLHIIRPDAVMSEYPAQGWEQQGIVINANASTAIPSQRWIVGEDVQLGPISMTVPHDIPPGNYLYQMGLFYVVDPVNNVYMREPYANREIRDWIVGTLEVTARRGVDNDSDIEVVLSDFESYGDLKKWESMRDGQIGVVSGGQALSGTYSGILAYPTQAYLPIVMLESFFSSAPPEYTDWERYDHLEFLFQGEFAPRAAFDAGRISIQVKDIGGSRFQRRLVDIERTEYRRPGVEYPVEADAARPDNARLAKARLNSARGRNHRADAVRRDRNTVVNRNNDEEGEGAFRPAETVYRMVLPVADIAGRVDIGNIRHLGFWAWGLPEDQDWYLTALIDDVKLVSRKGRKPEWTEPFVIFEGIEAPEAVSPGGVMEVAASFSIARKFRQNFGIFVHLIQEKEPHYAIHLERNPFRSTSTWEVGRIHREGPMYIPIPHDAPLGRYFINTGLYRTREGMGGPTRYVNAYKWADGIFTQDEPSTPVDFIKEAYLNRTSKEQWTVGHVTLVRRAAVGVPEQSVEAERMQEAVTATEREILSRPAPSELQQRTAPAVRRLRRPEAGGEGAAGE
ncbi:MAG: hypothetical protein PHN82_10710 [bacterium]|nr:hypothetical protein [bacterium]